MQKPENFETIEKNDTESVTSDDFSKNKWNLNEHEDIYIPDYTNIIRMAFTFKFLRERLVI